MRKSPFAVLILTLAVMSPGGCSKKDQQPDQPTPVKLNETVIPPLENKEKARVERRDQSGHLCELEILYTYGDVAVRYFDERSKVTKVRLDIKHKGIIAEGIPAPNGKGLTSFEAKNKDGVVLYSTRQVGPKTLRFSTFRADGTLHFTLDETENAPTNFFRQYHPDGKTLHIETDYGLLRKWLKLYDVDGKLLYEEKDAGNANPRDIVLYDGVVYGANGKPTMRYKCNEGPYSGWHQAILAVELLDEAGKVKSTFEPERTGPGWEDAYRDPLLERITMEKRDAGKLRNDGGLQMQSIEYQLIEVIED